MDQSLIFISIFPILGLFYYINRSLLSGLNIPPSVYAGFTALAAFSLSDGSRQTELFHIWKGLPGIMIAVVFAAIFLEKKSEDEFADKKEVIEQGVFVWLAVLGQTITGLALGIFIFSKWNPSGFLTGLLLEAGFAGGHGTSAALSEVLVLQGLGQARDIGQTIATSGIFAGTVLGLLILGKRGKLTDGRAKFSKFNMNTSELPSRFFISAFLIFITFGTGWFLHTLPLLEKLPLFVYTLIASVVVRHLLHRYKMDRYIYKNMIEFISLVSSEILIFTGIATIFPEVVNSYLKEIVLLVGAGLSWNYFATAVLIKRVVKLSPDETEKLAMINFGMLSGTTATGIMLLKIMDPELQSKALQIYGKAAPLSAPFIGGGVLTFTIPYILETVNPVIVLLLLVFFWFFLYNSSWLLVNRRLKFWRQ